jgi:hypothetical protein
MDEIYPNDQVLPSWRIEPESMEIAKNLKCLMPELEEARLSDP